MDAQELYDTRWLVANKIKGLHDLLSRKQQAQWEDWVSGAIAGSASQGHQFAKAGAQQFVGGQAGSFSEQLASSQQTWRAVWQRDSGEKRGIRARLHELRLTMVAPESQREDGSDLAKYLSQAPVRKQNGGDLVSAYSLRSASSESRQHVSQELYFCSNTATPCLQMLLVTVSMTPTTVPGERPITILSQLYRSMCKHSSGDLLRWEASFARLWDYAVANGGAITGARPTEFAMEAHKLLGDTIIGLLLDMATLFDIIYWKELLDDANMHNFPFVYLLLTLEVYTAPRILRKQQCLASGFRSATALWQDVGVQ